MRVYISGPISDVSAYDSLVAFNEAESKLVAAGCQVVNPRNTSHWGFTWNTYMKIAREILYSGEIDAVVMLKGWKESRGAVYEWRVAQFLGIQVIYWGGKE